MPFETGKSGNAAGRPTGAANRATQTVRDKFAQLLDAYSVEQLQADLAAIDNPKDRLALLIGLAEFVTPKLSRQALDAKVSGPAPFVFNMIVPTDPNHPDNPAALPAPDPDSL